MNPAGLERRAVENRLALLYGAIFLVFGVQTPFLPVWLSERGVSVDQIALAVQRDRSFIINEAIDAYLATHRLSLIHI